MNVRGREERLKKNVEMRVEDSEEKSSKMILLFEEWNESESTNGEFVSARIKI